VIAAGRRAYRAATEADATALSGLVRHNVVAAMLPGWTAAAIDRLRAESTPDALRAAIVDASFAQLCVDGEDPVGYVYCKSPRVIGLVVVDPVVHRLGIGSLLLRQALAHVADVAPDQSVVEVNATEYSMPFYRRHAFYPISEVFDHDGRRMVRMALWRRNPALHQG
jgi:GNAT superfamily N-acetyltransferase